MKYFKEGDIVYLESKNGQTWHTKGKIVGGRFLALETSTLHPYGVVEGIEYGLQDDEVYVLVEPAIINEYQIY